LEYPFGLQEVTQAMLTQIPEIDPTHELRGRPRNQHLAAVPDRHQSRSPVKCGPEVVTIAFLCLAGVNTDAHPGKVLGRERDLHGRGERDGVTRGRERYGEAVTTGREHEAVVGTDCFAQNLVVTS
jgi:hypothetical protein